MDTALLVVGIPLGLVVWVVVSVRAYQVARFVALRFARPRNAALVALGVVSVASVGVLMLPAALVFLGDIGKEPRKG